MIDLTTYALLRKQIATAASGVSDVRAEGDELVFVLADGHEVRMAIPATEIRDAVVRDDVLVLTLADDKEVVVDATLTQSGQAADARVTGDAVNQLKDDMTAKADKAALTRTDRSLDALWKLNQGISYNFETDEAGAYQKTVPSGAKLADVQSVGGKTVVWNQLMPIDAKYGHYSFSCDNTNIDGIITSTPKNTDYGGVSIFYSFEDKGYISNHKYYLVFEAKTNDENSVDFEVKVFGNRLTKTATNTDFTKYTEIISENNGTYIEIYSKNKSVFIVKNYKVFDLTQLFGSGNEPTDISDSRIAWIEQYAAAHPEYNAGELVSADVESVKYNDAIVTTIPSTVRALPGYGWSAGSVANTIERTEKGWRYVQRVSSVDMGTLNWFNEDAAAPASNVFSAYVPGMSKEGLLKNILFQSGRYTLNYTAYSKMNDKEYRGGNGANKLTICDKDYDSADAFKLSLNGENVNFGLSETIITDITSLMEEPFEVEAGGILIFENAAALPVPSSVEYIVSLAEVGA